MNFKRQKGLAKPKPKAVLTATARQGARVDSEIRRATAIARQGER